ncbi:GGDEF domain-containing protein [Demequina gelatinilytica]|uniref:GGDEF domain-containing protein n=1 Tax=Demequina gelatinilytica TaxID=1638980 RepID=UPI000780F619|nr:GGDEF domain-containing protein [Demequina gelatinilytica]
MLDPLTLRVAMTAVAATLLVLSYTGVYLRDRSRFAAWWSASLVAVATSTTLYLLNGSEAQSFSVPLANALGVLGAVCTWAAARSLSGRRTGWGRALIGPAATMLVTLLDHPATDTWAGGATFLAAMAAFFGLAAHAMREVRLQHRESNGRYSSASADRATTVLGVTVGALSAIYAVRTVLFVSVGPESAVFDALVGTVPITIALIVALVVVTFTMTELSQAERVFDLELRATRDSLTRLWNRPEFVRRAALRIAQRSAPTAIVVADLDHFKALNDAHGHAAGDRALAAFGSAVRHALGPRDLAGRLGGEEFALLIATSDAAAARARVEALRVEFADAGVGEDAAPTVSCGIAFASANEPLSAALQRADEAMYQAKREGRDRVVVSAGV